MRECNSRRDRDNALERQSLAAVLMYEVLRMSLRFLPDLSRTCDVEITSPVVCAGSDTGDLGTDTLLPVLSVYSADSCYTGRSAHHLIYGAPFSISYSPRSCVFCIVLAVRRMCGDRKNSKRFRDKIARGRHRLQRTLRGPRYASPDGASSLLTSRTMMYL